MKDDLLVSAIETELAARGIVWARPLVVAAWTTSTNDDAKRAAREGAPAGTAFVADAQTSGRGRLGRAWYSPPGENLYASFVLRPCFELGRMPIVTLAAGLAVADAIAPLMNERRVTLKWPNDVFIEGRKVAGILSEAQLTNPKQPWIVVGIGINVHARSFPEDIAASATSLALSGATSLHRGSLFVALTEALFARTEMLRQGAVRTIIRDFAERDALLGRRVTVDGAPAVALGIGEDGTLRIRLPDGRETQCVAGDVAIGT
jgi:BirA family transcriptional regulator, biotin operon repressor / biotin---[acetyl-CoA-carboxylase] ligase